MGKIEGKGKGKGGFV